MKWHPHALQYVNKFYNSFWSSSLETEAITCYFVLKGFRCAMVILIHFSPQAPLKMMIISEIKGAMWRRLLLNILFSNTSYMAAIDLSAVCTVALSCWKTLTVFFQLLTGWRTDSMYHSHIILNSVCCKNIEPIICCTLITHHTYWI